MENPWVFICGFGGLWAWIFLTVDTGLSHFSFFGQDVPWLLHFVALLSSCVTCIVWLCKISVFQRVFLSRLFATLMTLAAIAATVLWNWQWGRISPVWQLVAAVADGVAIVWYYSLWGAISAQLKGDRTLLYTSVSLLAGAIMFYVGRFVLPDLASVLASCCILTSTFLALAKIVHRTLDLVGATDVKQAPCASARFSSFAELISPRVYIGFAGIVFVYALSRTALITTPEYSYDLPMPMIITAAAFGLIVLLQNKACINLAFAYKIAVILTACASILAILFCSVYIQAVAGLVGASIILVEITNWVLAIFLAKRMPALTVALFIFIRLINHAAQVAGSAVGVILLPDHALLLLVVSSIVLMLVASFSFPDRELTIVIDKEMEDNGIGIENGAERLNGNEAGMDSGTAVTLDEAALEAIALRFGLTDREKDIMRYWVVGYTHVAIESMLVISKSTVKTHIKHLYEKTGVHSKIELIELFNSGRWR
ncbi:response regulator transcription factor [Raoultibacter phocaeensis]|uniref:response regulator transcription factor n=1 Tax=Raoultibacter phocaeensis TaxID=2479841 RepID=UPI0015D65BAE|nr:helix-turn-helix transcriptional regulator [Raoultibacter phocaeensis]